MDDVPATPLDALKKAVKLVGSQEKLAKAIGKTGQSYISMLLYRLKNEPDAKIDAEICPGVEAATNGAVTREQLRPDFPWQPRAAGQAEQAA